MYGLKLLRAALPAVLMACGSGSSGPGDVAAPCREQPDAARAEQIALLRDRVLRIIDGSPCPGADCQMTTFQTTPAAATTASEGARVLLIDEAIITVAATRYQSRTLAFLRRDAEGFYLPGELEIWLAADALRVFQAVDRFPGPLASEEIEVATAFVRKFGNVIPNWTGHGMDILPFLEDRMPRAQFVVSEALLDVPLGEASICGVIDAGTREAALQRLETQLGNTRQSLSRVIEQYAINYVHLSWGITAAQIEQLVQSRCGAAPPREVVDRIQRDYLDLLEALARLSVMVAGRPQPVLMFQAATGSPGVLKPNDPDFITDCTPFAGRLRVHVAAYTGTDIPIGGSSDPRFMTQAAQRALACLDVVVNVGYSGPFDVRAAPAYFPTTSLGLGAFPPEWPAESSFANPVGLAYFAYLSDQHPGETQAQLVDRVTHQDSKPVVDPLLFAQFPRPSQRVCTR